MDNIIQGVQATTRHACSESSAASFHSLTKQASVIIIINNNNDSSSSSSSIMKRDWFVIDFVAALVLEFLDMSDLFAISKTSKTLRDAMRPHHVVGAALVPIGNQQAKATMEILLPLIRERKIIIPSPMRLLQLCTAKDCEKCGRFIGTTRAKKNSALSDFGLFFCNVCFIRSRENVWWGERPLILNKPSYIATSEPMEHFDERHDEIYLLDNEFRDRAGVRVGPLLTGQDLKAVKETGGAFLNDIIYRVTPDLYSKFTGEFARAYQESYEAGVEQREERERMALKLKRRLVPSFIAKLEQHVEDAPWKPWAFQWASCPREESTVRFTSNFMQTLLNKYTLDPRKVTPDKMQELAGTIQDAFNLLWKKNMHDLTCYAESEGRDRQMLVELSRIMNPNYEHLRQISREDIAMLRLGMDPTDLKSFRVETSGAIIVLISSTISSREAEEENSHVVLLACAYWKAQLARRTFSSPWLQYKVVLRACQEEFPAVYESFVLFVDSNAWKEKTPSKLREQRLVEAANGIVGPALFLEACFELLSGHHHKRLAQKI